MLESFFSKMEWGGSNTTTRGGVSYLSVRVICYCDNDVVVGVIPSRTSKEQDLMHLLHCKFVF